MLFTKKLWIYTTHYYPFNVSSSAAAVLYISSNNAFSFSYYHFFFGFYPFDSQRNKLV